MSIIFKHIINAFLFLCIVKSSFIFSQTYNPQTQNRSWSANNSISTVFLKASGVDITITPNLNMIQFVDSNGDTYGYDGDNDIPTNWTYEILDGNDDVPADTTVSADKKTIIFTADPDEDIDIYLKVIDNNGNIIDNLSRVQLRLYIRGNLTVASAQWNACEQAYLLSVNEQTRDGVKLCAPYRVIVYELKSGSIDTSNVIYDSNSDSGHNVNSNSFTLNLGVGNYAAIITNSCNEQVNSSGDGYYYFSVTEAYSIGASSIFSGYQCVGDGFGTTVIKLEGAAKPITWQLKNSNGQVILTHNNTSQYSYQNYNEQFDTQNFTVTIPNLSTGTYTFTFTDGNACSEDLTFKIQRPEEIKASVIQNDSKLQLACYGDSDGEITFLASGGWTEPWDGNYVNPNGWGDPYTFSLTKDGKTFSSGDVLRHFVNGNQVGYKTSFTGLSAGSYSLIVRENVATNPYNSNTIYNCAKVFQQTFTISEPDEFTSSGSVTDIDCNGNESGAIDLSVDGGTANYIYAWTKTGDDSYSATTQDLTDLSAGTYNVTITDASDCTTTNSFTIVEPTELIIADAGLSTEIACFGDNGLIRVNITQATVASYTYALYQGDSVVQTTTISDLNYTFSAPAGTYEVRVTDANGCASSFTTELTQAEEELLIDIEKTDLNCYNSNNGTITVTTSGGVAPYTFSWSDSGTGNYRDGLTIGTYTVTITDSIGCVKVRTVEIENGDLFNIDPVVTPISCFGADDGSIELNLEGGVSPISFIWSDDSNAGQSRNNLPPGDYSVLIQDASGCEIQRDFTIIEPEEISIAAVVTNATDCDNPASGSIDLQISGGNSPYIFQWSNGAVTEDISALIAQTYSVTVTDSKGCISEKEFTITRPDDLEIDLATNIYAVCESREVFQNNTLSISGGVAPYIIQWSGGEVTGNNNEIMDTKIDGSYQVTVTDALGCSESISFDVSTPEIGFPDFTYDSFYLSNYDALSTKDPIDFTNLSTEDFFSVYWDFGDGNYSEEVDAQHTYDKKGTYQVTLTVEFILGCSYSITKTIYIGDSFEIVIPNAFTPNNDGYNDNFRAVYYGFKYLKMQIFDTWGTLIYSEESRTDELIGWNGRIGSKDGENGNYFYQVSGNSFTDVKFAKNGSFTLIR